MEPVVALVAVLAASSVLGLVLRRRDGGFRGARDTGALTAADLGGPLHPTATFVLVTQPTCATCPQARRVLRAVSDEHRVGLREVDAEADLPLARRLGVLRTPTVLLLDGAGRIRSRSSGALRPDQALAALTALSAPLADAPTRS